MLQVEIFLERRQPGIVHGYLCSWLLGQHASSIIWSTVSSIVFVLHGAHLVGSVPCHGYCRLRVIIPVYLQDFRISEGRLGMIQLNCLVFCNIALCTLSLGRLLYLQLRSHVVHSLRHLLHSV